MKNLSSIPPDLDLTIRWSSDNDFMFNVITASEGHFQLDVNSFNFTLMTAQGFDGTGLRIVKSHWSILTSIRDDMASITHADTSD